MIINGYELSMECLSVSFETGLLRLSCHKGEDAPMEMLLINPQNPYYLQVITWAINSGKLNDVNAT